MIDPATQQRLQECIRRESRSLFQYVRDVPLWAPPADRPGLERLRELARAEQHATDALAAWMQKQHAAPPPFAAFPSAFLHYNDSGVRHLLPRIQSDHAQALAALEADTATVTDPDARVFLDSMLAIKRRNDPELTTLFNQESGVRNDVAQASRL